MAKFLFKIKTPSPMEFNTTITANEKLDAWSKVNKYYPDSEIEFLGTV